MTISLPSPQVQEWEDLQYNFDKIAATPLVNSFNGRSGTVTPQSGDYVSSQVLAGTVTQPTRSLGVAYQPNTTKFTSLAVTASVGTGAGAGGANIKIGPTSSPSTTAISGTIAQQGTFTLQIPLTTIVPPGWYYEIVNIANITAINVTETAL